MSPLPSEEVKQHFINARGAWKWSAMWDTILELDAEIVDAYADYSSVAEKREILDIKMRKLYDSQVQCRQRYATFIGTTNDPTPLTDTTGSRRFLCIRTMGVIDTHSPIDYDQLYAQVLHELRDGLPTHFTKAEEKRIQQQNAAFQQFDSLQEVFSELFHLPQKGEAVMHLSAIQLLGRMRQHSPAVRIDDSAVKRLSRMLLSNGFSFKHTKKQNEFTVAQNQPKGEG